LATAFQGQKKASPSMITPRGRWSELHCWIYSKYKSYRHDIVRVSEFMEKINYSMKWNLKNMKI
jgi:hypothetical protein